MELAAGLLAQAGYRDTGGGSMQADSAGLLPSSDIRKTGDFPQHEHRLESRHGRIRFLPDSDDQLPPKAIENLVRMAELYSHPHMVCGAVDVLPQTDPAQSIHDQVQAYTEGNKKCHAYCFPVNSHNGL